MANNILITPKTYNTLSKYQLEQFVSEVLKQKRKRLADITEINEKTKPELIKYIFDSIDKKWLKEISYFKKFEKKKPKKLSAMDRILKNLNLPTSKEDNTLTNLYAKVKELPSAIQPHIKVESSGYVYQADLLYLPPDDGYQFCLVVVDCNNNAVDGEPLKTRDADATKEAFEKIFKRKYLKLPKFQIQVDQGTEFKNNTVESYFTTNHVNMRFGKAGRHQQQCLVEYYNKIIGKLLYLFMTSNEMHLGEQNNMWVEELPKVIAQLNLNLKRNKSAVNDTEVLDDVGDELLPLHSKVRVALDNPIEYHSDKKLGTKFRATDIRWSKEPHEIDDYYLVPSQPPEYIVSDIPETIYQRNELQPFTGKEAKPKPTAFIVEKLLERKMIKDRVNYLVKWKGYPESEATYEPRMRLLEIAPIILKDYEKEQRKK